MTSVPRRNSTVIVLMLELQVISSQWVSNQFGKASLITDLLITDYFRCYAGNLSEQEYD